MCPNDPLCFAILLCNASSLILFTSSILVTSSKGLPVLFIFPKNQPFVALVLCNVLQSRLPDLYYFSPCADFRLDFLSLFWNLGVHVAPLFIGDFSGLFLMQTFRAGASFPLTAAFIVPPGSNMLCFHFHFILRAYSFPSGLSLTTHSSSQSCVFFICLEFMYFL